ncbi:hypothetical protein GV054_02200 [Marinomonas mediterranea]|uniref:ADP-ribosyltransferase domain-containing protein n=1 Tax=Marinomonas mediterranea TaxID=119864 RepID=UPI00234B7530|nr:ADP-ribosyltransferase domain-containing protein [Marinomonas mediterranea]WCN11911.1 hypothetical protein GV054_02200 [Marinomonas mediterranea]
MPLNNINTSFSHLKLEIDTTSHASSSNTHADTSKSKSMASMSKFLNCFASMNSTDSPKTPHSPSTPETPETPTTPDYVAMIGEKRIQNSDMKRSLAQLIDRFNSSDDPYKSTAPKPAEFTIARSLEKKDRSLFAHNALSDDEFLGLNLYTSALYRPINQHLRYEAKADTAPVVDAMISGMNKLAKIPDYRVDQTVYRGIEKRMTDQEVQQRFQQYSIYSDSAFMSSSLDEAEAAEFTGPVQLQITPVTAIKAEEFSDWPDENEAIFKPNTQFFVDDVTKDDNGKTWRVKLTEVDDVIADFVKNR